MYSFSNFSEIEKEINKLQLEKEIAIEKLKIVNYESKELLRPINWLTATLQSLSKYGLLVIIKRIFRKL